MSAGTRRQRSSLYFVGPNQVQMRRELLPSPGHNEVLIRTSISAISAGTEMLFYRNMVDDGMQLDIALTALSGQFHYPFKYGYALVGRVEELGEGVPYEWLDRSVFCFHPHESHFITPLADIVPIPKNVEVEDSVFLPFIEAALSFVMDGRPIVGENVVVLGQGVIGLLTTAILSMFPLSSLVTLDGIKARREKSLAMGADQTFDHSMAPTEFLKQSGIEKSKADLVFEVSGNPQAFDYALSVAGFDARIVLGSWYGNRPTTVHLGKEFHRNRAHIISSQVSSLAPTLQGRWSKERRLGFTWKLLEQVQPSKLITHRFSLDDAENAYRLIDTNNDEVCQLVFVYDKG